MIGCEWWVCDPPVPGVYFTVFFATCGCPDPGLILLMGSATHMAIEQEAVYTESLFICLLFNM